MNAKTKVGRSLFSAQYFPLVVKALKFSRLNLICIASIGLNSAFPGQTGNAKPYHALAMDQECLESKVMIPDCNTAGNT